VLPGARRFLAAYHRTFPRRVALAQTAAAYDAAMAEIRAIKALIRAGKTVSRAHLGGFMAAAKDRGASGSVGVDPQGSGSRNQFSLYTYDPDGAWHFLEAVTHGHLPG